MSIQCSPYAPPPVMIAGRKPPCRGAPLDKHNVSGGANSRRSTTCGSRSAALSSSVSRNANTTPHLLPLFLPSLPLHPLGWCPSIRGDSLFFGVRPLQKLDAHPTRFICLTFITSYGTPKKGAIWEDCSLRQGLHVDKRRRREHFSFFCLPLMAFSPQPRPFRDLLY